MVKTKWWLATAMKADGSNAIDKKMPQHLINQHLISLVQEMSDMSRKVVEEYETKANTFLMEHTRRPKGDAIGGLKIKDREKYWVFFDQMTEHISPLWRDINEICSYLVQQGVKIEIRDAEF